MSVSLVTYAIVTCNSCDARAKVQGSVQRARKYMKTNDGWSSAMGNDYCRPCTVKRQEKSA